MQSSCVPRHMRGRKRDKRSGNGAGQRLRKVQHAFRSVATTPRGLCFDCALVLGRARRFQHAHPARVDDAVAAYRKLLELGVSAAHVAFASDSVGGGPAIGAQLRARDGGLPLPAGSMVMSASEATRGCATTASCSPNARRRPKWKPRPTWNEGIA